jgi:hypothetical protein
LSRSFIGAGAGGVVSSLWKVSDESTSALMKEFYDRMIEEKAPAAVALSDARGARKGSTRIRSTGLARDDRTVARGSSESVNRPVRWFEVGKSIATDMGSLPRSRFMRDRARGDTGLPKRRARKESVLVVGRVTMSSRLNETGSRSSQKRRWRR